MKQKPVNWCIIGRDNVSDSDGLYEILDTLMEQYHEDVQGAVIVIMWRYNLKIDADGYIQLADISKTADKYRELQEHDYILGINKDTWSMLDDSEKRTVIDSQLNRIAISADKDGEPREDDRGRIIYRTKKEQVTISDNESVLLRRHGHTITEIQDKVVSKMKWVGGDDKEPVPEGIKQAVETIIANKENDR